MFNPVILRRISTVVLVAFSSLTLQPLQAAVVSEGSAAAPAPDKSQRYGQSLEQIRDLLQRAQSKQEQGQAPTDEIAQLRSNKAELDALEADVEADFAAVGQHLREHNLPAEILARHDAALAEFHASQAEFKQKFQDFDAADAANDPVQRPLKLKELAAYMQAQQHRPAHTPSDPHKLPFRTPDGNVRPPIETEAGYQASLFKAMPIHLAANGSLSGITLPSTALPATPTDADLAETEDIQLTDAIKAQAQALDHNPVKIHNWVRNSIEYLPTYGSIQGADMTLQSQRGNAFDTASLEIALLRASGIPARYVYGTVQIPAEQAMNWVGGVHVPEAAQSLFGQGGIPNVGLASGGLIKYIKLEHVWVEAWVDYVPSRGAVNKTGDSWIPLDASYKQYQYTQGMDLKNAVPLDAQALVTQSQAGATLNETEGWVQNLNSANLQGALTDYQAQLKTYIDSQKPDATVGDVLGSKTIAPQSPSLLMGTLPYQVLATGARMTALPDNLRHKIKLNLYVSAFNKFNGFPSLAVSINFSQLGTKRLSAVYKPSTDDDAQTIAAYAGSSKLPVYLINQSLSVQLDEKILAEFGPQRMGSEQYWTYTLSMPGGAEVEEDFKLTSSVGDQVVFGIDGNGITNQQVVDRYNAVNPNSPLENLHHLALGYWVRADLSDDVLAKSLQTVAFRQASVGIFMQPLSVTYYWGIPRSGSYKSYNIDIRRLMASAIGASGTSAKNFMLQSGMKNSYLEGRVFEEVFDDSLGIGASAASVLANAINYGIRVWQISQTNLSNYLAVSSLSPELKIEISNAANAGNTVFAPETEVDTDFWRGGGYVAVDEATGAGAYILNGANGSEMPDCEESSQPLIKSISAQITTFLILALLTLLITGGTIGSFGSAAPALIYLAVIVMGATTLTWSPTSYAAGKCKTDNCHRGRFQAQGEDIIDGKGQGKGKTKSEAWAQPTPLTLTQALNLLEALKSKLYPFELASRVEYFIEAETHIKDLAQVGGVCAPYPKSFGPNPSISDHVQKGIRVDLEVIKGEAFRP